MSIKNKRITWGIAGFIVLVILFIAIMTWFYPYSHFSVHKSYTYKPGEVLYNGDKTYQDIVSEFKESYEIDLNEALESDNTNFTVERTRYILPIFEQDWLVSTDSESMDKNKLDKMLFDVKQSRDTLLNLVAEEEYTSEEKSYLIDNIKDFLRLEGSIRQLRDGKYFSKRELDNLFGNLRNDFRSNFNFYVTTFYEMSH